MAFALPLLLSSLLASAPSSQSEEVAVEKKAPLTRADLDHQRMLMFVAGRAGGQFIDASPGFGGGAQIGVGVRLVRGLFLQAEVGEGFYDGPGQNVGVIIGGLRYEFRKPRRLRPSVFAGFTHAHQSTFARLGEAPVATLAGADHALEHRTGLQLDAALRIPFPEKWRGPLPRFSTVVRADAAYYFDGVPGALHVGVGVGLSVTFGGGRAGKTPASGTR